MPRYVQRVTDYLYSLTWRERIYLTIFLLWVALLGAMWAWYIGGVGKIYA